MGKNQKIPYLNEVLIYFVKVIMIFLILSFALNKIGFYNQPLLLVFSIFAAFSFNPFYLISIVLSYLIMYRIFSLGVSDLVLLFLYLFAVLLDTLIMILYLSIKYKFKEEK